MPNIFIQIKRFIAGINRIIMSNVIRLYLKLCGISYGRNLRIFSFPGCLKHPQAKIDIGDNVTIYNKISENRAGITNRTQLVADYPNAHLKIGNHVGISGAIIYCRGNITIGDYVNLGAGAKIYDNDFHPITALERREHVVDHIAIKDVKICDDVWIGNNATILKGVTIGPRSVVAANAVVTCDIPADVVVAGVPARVKKQIDNTAKQ